MAVLFIRGDDPRPGVLDALAAEQLELVEWRVPPVDPHVLGDLATRTCPEMLHVVFRDPSDEVDETAAYRLRRRIERATSDVYVASCSFRTIVYKGLVAADHLADYYLDLADERFAAPFAIFHQRFSTNTLPTWERAQPFRMLCHNGEINTVQGNENRMQARRFLATDQAGLGPEELFHPVLDPAGSDSAKLDEAAELLMRGGRHVCHATAMLVPEAWEETRDLDPEVRGFYEYHSALDGAVGWSRRCDLHRWCGRGRRAGPQWPAAPSLQRDRGRLDRVLLRGRRQSTSVATAVWSAGGSGRVTCSS